MKDYFDLNDNDSINDAGISVETIIKSKRFQEFFYNNEDVQNGIIDFNKMFKEFFKEATEEDQNDIFRKIK